MPFWRRAEPESPDTVRSLRESAGLSRDEMADRLGASRLEFSAWESGAIPIPPGLPELIRYRIALQAHVRAREEAGVAPCAWREENADRLAAMRTEALVRMCMGRSELLRHQARCRECIAAAAFERRQPPPEPPSLFGAVGRWLRAVRRPFPRWLHPVLNLVGWGVSFVCAMLLMAAYDWLTGDRDGLDQLPGVLANFLLAGVSFAVGTRAVERMWDRAPTVASALLTVITILPVSTMVTMEQEWINGTGLIVWTVLAAIIGGLVGWSSSRPPSDGAKVLGDTEPFLPHSRPGSPFDTVARTPAAEAVPRRDTEAP